jgi:hypothetical protein
MFRRVISLCNHHIKKIFKIKAVMYSEVYIMACTHASKQFFKPMTFHFSCI